MARVARGCTDPRRARPSAAGDARDRSAGLGTGCGYDRALAAGIGTRGSRTFAHYLARRIAGRSGRSPHRRGSRRRSRAAAGTRHRAGPRLMPKMTFIERDGTRREVEAPLGASVLQVARRHDIDIEGACEGSLACSTCHVIVDPDWYDLLNEASVDEDDMLDLAFNLTKTSRLGCQIIITEEIDGLTVRLPAATRNLLFG